MSFGQKVLEKYGWKKGDGLGKNGSGMKEALKPKQKNNNLGLGFRLGEEFQDKWWENAYNQAASNIEVKIDEKGTVCVASPLDEEIEYLPHKKKKSRRSIKEEYSQFEKTNEKDVVDLDSKVEPGLDDTTLFELCGGRTVHKGARHGLNLSGKLERLERHEKQVLHDLREGQVKKKKKKKRKKSKEL